MALQKQPVSINLAAGLDTKTDSKHVVPGRLTKLENGVYRKGMSISKRNGYDEINNIDLSANALGVGSSVEVFNDELLQYNNQKLYSYSEGSSAWVDKGDALTAVIESMQIVKNTASQTQCDSAVLNGIGVYAWEDSRTGIRASVIDETSGSVLLADVLLNDDGFRVKCLALGQYIFVTYIDSLGRMYIRRINPLSPTAFETEVQFSTTVNTTNTVYDAIVYQDKILIIHNVQGSTASRSHWFDEDLNVLTGVFQTRTYSGLALDNCVAIVPTVNNQIFVFHHQGTSMRVFILDNAGRLVSSGFVLETITQVDNVTGVLNADGDGVKIFYEVPGTTADETYIKQCNVVSAVDFGPITTLVRSVGLYSRAWVYTDSNNIRSVFLGVAHESTLQSTYFVIRDDGLIIGKQQYTNGGGLTSRPLLATVNQDSDAFTYAILKKNRIVSENATIFTPTGVMRTKVDFANSNRFIAKQLGNNLLIVGGVLNMYDGQSVVEHGFLLYPENITAAAVGSGGSLADGAYLIYLVYEWTDNFGQIHRSRPSVAESVTCSAGGTDSITVTAPTLRLTRKDGTNRSNISIVGYITEANGTVAYRFTSVSAPTFNSVTSNTVSLGTITSVSTSNEILYTTGGVLPNDPAPACSVIEVFQNRAWLGGLEEKSAVNFSKENKAGAPVEFAEDFTKAIVSSGGKVKALSFIDDKLIVMKADTAFITYGDGPNDTDTLGGFAEFESIAVDVGSENPRSITKLPNAIILKSKKGFYAIDSTLSSSYIGADVEEFNSLSVTSANLIPDLNECRFTTSNGDMLIYNYFFNRWSTATNLQASSAVVWKNKLVVLKNSGKILSQNASAWKDANGAYGMKLESGWISMGNLSSYKRVYQLLIFGTYKSNHKIRIKLAYDNNDAWEHSGVYDPTTEFPVETYGDDSPYGESGTVYGGEPIDYCIRVNMKRQKCSSFKFEIEELVTSATTGTQESLTISDLGILVGLKKGIVKKPQSRNLKVN